MMRVLHFSDVHVQEAFGAMPVAELMGKRLLAAGNLLLTRGRLFREVPRKLEALARFAQEERTELVICTGDYTALDRVLDEVRARGVLRIPVEFSAPPEEGPPPEFYLDPKTGEPAGIAPIIGGLVARDLGVRLECVNMPWPDHVPALLDGRVDFLPKHVNTPERALHVEFGVGRFTVYRVTALVRDDSGIASRDALNREGRIITV